MASERTKQEVAAQTGRGHVLQAKGKPRPLQGLAGRQPSDIGFFKMNMAAVPEWVAGHRRLLGMSGEGRE